MIRKHLSLTFGAAVMMVMVFLTGLWRGWGQITVPDALPFFPDRATTVEQRIDPNTADEAVLACLPEIGEALARRMVEVRKERQTKTGQTQVFRSREDLLTIHGLGEKTVRQFERYLVFPTATSRPRSLLSAQTRGAEL
jgi:DNA uptake protein ComE-like DNA-binding protein